MNNSIFLRHIKNESKHWWFKARGEIIEKTIKKNVSNKLKILDFGSGSGTNIKILNKFGTVYVYEKNKQIREYLKKKFKRDKKITIINNLKKYKFDLILAADVIEHIKNDHLIIRTLNQILKKGGKLIITVPAFQFLYSKKDKVLRHYRRYTIYGLKKKLNEFKILKISYFNFFLFIPLCIIILFYKIFNLQFIEKVENIPNKFINKFLYLIFRAEKLFINKINFPFGLSILSIVEKK